MRWLLCTNVENVTLEANTHVTLQPDLLRHCCIHRRHCHHYHHNYPYCYVIVYHNHHCHQLQSSPYQCVLRSGKHILTACQDRSIRVYSVAGALFSIVMMMVAVMVTLMVTMMLMIFYVNDSIVMWCEYRLIMTVIMMVLTTTIDSTQNIIQAQNRPRPSRVLQVRTEH